MKLAADIALRRGELSLDVQLQVAAGETVALLGPNGAGKSTCLQVIAGLLRIDRGRVALGEQVFDGGPAAAALPPEQRRVGMVFQEHRLFPHLTALQNVAYGLAGRGVSRAERRLVASRWLERVGLPLVLHAARPAALSGGQQQRVALARALAPEPAVLLLDEPLAAVDASARLLLRRELRQHLATFAGPRVLVAHDIHDALALADHIVVLENGLVVQQGAAVDLVGRPRTAYVADLVGINGFAGSARAGVVTIGTATLTVASPLAGDVLVTFHPRAVSLFRERPSGSPRNVWSAPVVAIEPSLERVRVRLGGPLPLVAEVTPAAVRDLGLDGRLADGGGEVWVAIKATEIGVVER